MGDRLKREIHQSKPFGSRQEECFLQLLRTSDVLQRGEADVLREGGLSSTQYNALRILRGAGSGGLTCGEIGERMVTRDPDITRLLDRLEKQGFVERARQEEDRRVVRAWITAKGLRTLRALDQPVADHLTETIKLSPEEIDRLIELLEKLRAGIGVDPRVDPAE